MRIKFFLLFFIVNTKFIYSQIENKNLFPSPNAAGLGLYGQIPVNLYSGLPAIDIPIYQFRSRDLSIPLHLNYHAAGIKPSDHASWVGLGWNLEAGGAITRILNDLPDEFIDYHLNPSVNRGFFNNSNYLSSSTWATTDLGTDEKNVYPDFYCGPCGSLYLYTSPDRIDLSPDEFQFNFLGMSGSLIMGQDGQWKLISKEGLNFKVTTEIGQYSLIERTSSNASIIRNCLKKFTLIASDGTQYTFGGNEAIEFGRKGVGIGDFSSRDGGTVPNAWYLSEIKSISGDIITLQYTRDGYQIMVNSNNYGYFSSCDVCTTLYTGGGMPDDEFSIVDGTTLSSITGSNGSILFNKSKANILDYTIQSTCFFGGGPAFCSWLNKIQPAYAYELFQTGNTGPAGGPASTFMKLNEIVIKDAVDSTLKSFKLNYYENPNNRLFLNSVTESGSDGSLLQPYSFSYNNIAGLANIPYSTLNVDHWGYYNAVDPRTGLSFPLYANPLNAYNSTFNSTYTYNRSPVVAPMQYGVLTQITYPTGGNSEFVWEPHTYSKCINQDPVNGNPSITIQDLGTSIMAGGLRIKQINSQANFNSPLLTKNYFYYRDYTNNNYASSGLLNSAPPKYVTEYTQTGNFFYRKWSSYSSLPLHYTNGAPITYTNVQEINSDGSYKAYTYSNQDNGYLNTLPIGGLIYGFTHTNLKEINTNSLELERGLLLKESTYSLNSILLNSKSYQYNDDPARFSTAVRKIYFTRDFALNGTVLSFDNYGFLNVSSNGPVAYKSDNLFALNKYCYYPFVKSVTETQYDQNGTNPLTITKAYTYDNYRNKKTETVTSSKSEQLITSYNYSPDNITGLSTLAQAGKTAMQIANIVTPVLEKTITRSSLQIEHTRTDYQQYENINKFIAPLNSYKSVNANALEIDVKYENFDSKGNILQYITRDGIVSSFDWGYNQAYPIVKINNSMNTIANRNVLQPAVGNQSLFWGAGQFQSQQITFNHITTGNIVVGFGYSDYPGVTNFRLNYTLTGPVNQSGTLCISGDAGSPVCYNPSSITFSSMPSGNYTLSAFPNSDYSKGVSCSMTYQSETEISVQSGIKEFFFDGFEENTSPNVLTGIARSGKKYYSSNYTTSFVPPNSRNYTIQWWNLVAGQWKFNQQSYVPNMVLNGTLDDVRIFPTDAFMTTYTFSPLVGMTSETDPNGKTTYYEYDTFSRLKLIRDQDGNILKTFDYKYQQ